MKMALDHDVVVSMVIAVKISETYTRKEMRTPTYSQRYLDERG